jgi:cellulose synthase/poly-beta-1,6-N-acetylglucosamine synthase-like glycosyltransferase
MARALRSHSRLAKLRPNLSDSPTASDGLVSVIIPARNERAVIETVVTSVLASAYRPIEVLVVDDRSTTTPRPGGRAGSARSSATAHRR